MKRHAIPGSDGDGATVVISSKVREGGEEEYRRWQRRMTDAMHAFPGFEGAEVYPPIPGEQGSWVVVCRFSSAGRLTGWLDSEVRARLLAEVRPLLEEPSALEVLAGRGPGGDAVTAVISHRVRPGREREFLRWQEEMRKAQERFPGFLGVETFEPVPGIQEHWVVLLRYDTREHLDGWMDSAARGRLLRDGRDCVLDFDVRTVRSAFSGWFRSDGGAQQGPPDWKQAMSVLLALYPTVMVLNLTLVRVLLGAGWPVFLVLFVGNMASVALLTWALMPLVNRAFAWWLRPGVPARASAAGALVLVAGYAACVAVFGLIAR
ncbi:antibiotic biosynthesis monooxygenase [Nonomuraea roseoviolacea]|uniref:Antibiotic biosynthesis monooxygenase (ABM) superfamily enzyme n=1 Tax=Nonomuraea roseoviolacea subsp. carminata TaxID=160689 RepID=A0ABT1KD56_9ACTN|nr:antibiotic biosynthesis monooxygenase [Nonomuraea roseoviolacea]MCP2351945.1 antibiotic biosynthesis monooxygenase (ABM) superfamily enzyme [Nonomuraea roseoviolacea subsp. carminata]